MEIKCYFQKAYEKVQAELKKRITDRNVENHPNNPVIVDCESFEYGWLFYYNGKYCVENNDPNTAYIGNVPYFVDKFDGEIKVFPVIDYKGEEMLSIEQQIERYFQNKYPDYLAEKAKREAEWEQEMEELRKSLG